MQLERMVVPVEWKTIETAADDIPAEWKADADDENTLIGYASTFGNVDLGGDVVVPGAFTKTIDRVKAEGIPLLADHMASTASVLGTIVDAVQNAKGLIIKARLSKAPSAQDTAIKLREGHLSKLSIGYETMDDAYEDRDGARVRLLKEIKLWETSVVVFPMNPKATITRVKSLFEDVVDAGIVKPAELIDEFKSQMSTLDLWRTELAIEVKHGVNVSSTKTSDPAAAQPGEAGTAAQSASADGTATPEAGGEPAATPGEGGSGSWDKYRSEAILAGRPTGDADPVVRARLSTQLELAESQLAAITDKE